jgi:single-strand DNA-binding protein
MSDTITITGNLAAEPERKPLPSGGSVTTFRLASSQRRYDRTTETWIDGPTNWYTVSAFRHLGEHVFSSLHRGERVIVVGRLRLREWETPNTRGTSAEIAADAIGHDLLWGTSVFTRAARDAQGGAQSGAGAAVGSDAWAAPGADVDAVGWTEPMALADERDGTDREVTQLVETPF